MVRFTAAKAFWPAAFVAGHGFISSSSLFVEDALDLALC